jgi:hypothetical protein
VRQQQVTRRRARRGDVDGAAEDMPPARPARAADTTARVLTQIDEVLRSR